MKKSEVLLQAVLRIMHAPRQMLPEEELKGIFGKSKSTFYRYLEELTKFEIIDGEPAIRRIKDGENFNYAINKNMFKYFVPEHLETAFFLEAYRHLGHLLDHPQFNEDIDYLKKDILNLNGRGEQLERKFYYLSKVATPESYYECPDAQTHIVQALINNNLIKLKYNNKDYQKVYPLTLCQYRDALYLIGYKNEEKPDMIRKFKLKRILAIEILDESFSYPTKEVWHPETYFQNASGIITDTPEQCTIRVFSYSRELIGEKDFFSSQLVENTEHYDEYQLTYSNINEFLGQLFVYAQDVEIVEPDELRDQFVKKALDAVKRNKLLKVA